MVGDGSAYGIAGLAAAEFVDTRAVTRAALTIKSASPSVGGWQAVSQDRGREFGSVNSVRQDISTGPDSRRLSAHTHARTRGADGYIAVKGSVELKKKIN